MVLVIVLDCMAINMFMVRRLFRAPLSEADRCWGIAYGEYPGTRTDPTLGGSEGAGLDTTVSRRFRGLRLGYATLLRHLRRAGKLTCSMMPAVDILRSLSIRPGDRIVPDFRRAVAILPAAAARLCLIRWMVDQKLQDRGQDRRRAAKAAVPEPPLLGVAGGNDIQNERASSSC